MAILVHIISSDISDVADGAHRHSLLRRKLVGTWWTIVWCIGDWDSWLFLSAMQSGLSSSQNSPACSPMRPSPARSCSLLNCLLFLVVGVAPHLGPLNPFLWAYRSQHLSSVAFKDEPCQILERRHTSDPRLWSELMTPPILRFSNRSTVGNRPVIDTP